MRHSLLIICAAGLVLTLIESAEAQQRVSFYTADSVEIFGDWYTPPDSSFGQVLLLLHMNRSNRASWKDFAVSAMELGYFVLAIDFRGHGESTHALSGAIEFDSLTNEDYSEMVLDVDAAVQWIKSQDELDTAFIGIIGASIGANVALNYASEHRGIGAIALLSPGLDYRGVMTEAPLIAYGDRLALIIAALDDNYASVSSTTLATAAGAGTAFYQYESGGHGTFLFESQPDLSERLIQFMHNSLK